MNRTEVEKARTDFLEVVQRYEAFAVLTAGCSVMAYLAQNMLGKGIASAPSIVLVFTQAMRIAFRQPPLADDDTTTPRTSVGALH